VGSLPIRGLIAAQENKERSKVGSGVPTGPCLVKLHRESRRHEGGKKRVRERCELLFEFAASCNGGGKAGIDVDIQCEKGA